MNLFNTLLKIRARRDLVDAVKYGPTQKRINVGKEWRRGKFQDPSGREANWMPSFKNSPTTVIRDVYTLTLYPRVIWLGLMIVAVSQAGVDYWGVNMPDIDTSLSPTTREGVIPTRHNSTAGANFYPVPALEFRRGDIIRVKSDSAVHTVDGYFLFYAPGK